MNRGRKPQTPQELQAKNTLRPVRHGNMGLVVEANALPQQPEWLTPEGESVWLDNIGRISATHGANEFDTDLFSNFCNLQGAIIATWRNGHVPPVGSLVEVRKMMELLRIAGPSSRVVKIAQTGGQTIDANPFKRNGR